MSAVWRAAGRDRPFLPASQWVHQLTDATPPRVTPERLHEGELTIVGRLTDASNATFLCDLAPATDGTPALHVVYKPIRGERPLDDFPRATLADREVAAHALSEATGWRIVPPTIKRDGPFGPGMVQVWVETDDEVDVVELVLGRDERLRRVCVFDVLANNADRKGGHLLVTAAGEINGVDHGICFAVAPKLRTVLWGWAGDRLSDDELAVVRTVCDALDGTLAAELGELLDREEVRATARRAERLLETGRFPEPDPLRPAIPWPPF